MLSEYFGTIFCLMLSSIILIPTFIVIMLVHNKKSERDLEILIALKKVNSDAREAHTKLSHLENNLKVRPEILNQLTHLEKVMEYTESSIERIERKYR